MNTKIITKDQIEAYLRHLESLHIPLHKAKQKLTSVINFAQFVYNKKGPDDTEVFNDIITLLETQTPFKLNKHGRLQYKNPLVYVMKDLFMRPFVITKQSQEIAAPSARNDNLQSIVLTPQRLLGGSLILLFIMALGLGLYTQFIKKVVTPLAYPGSPVTPGGSGGRIISFQGRLTDSLGNPITSAVSVEYNFYTTSSGGTSLQTETCTSVTPDQDGVFNSLIGSDPGCSTELPNSIFTENPTVYLGVKVASDPEMTPRQQIANVGYAVNSETLQGLPPGSNVSNIPIINKDGDLLMATSAPGVRSTYASATFMISSANAVTLQSAGTGDVNLIASGSGTIKLTTGSTPQLTVANNGDITTGTGTVTLGSLGTGLIKSTSGVLSNASAGTDYEVPLTFNNGLTRTSNTIKLGGTLTGATDIPTAGFDLSFSGTGNVGVGTSTPGAKLDVVGTLQTNNTVKFSGLGTGTATSVLCLDGSSLVKPCTTVSASGIALNNITAATGTNTINNVDNNQEWDWNSLTTGPSFTFGSNSTAGTASGTSTVLNIARSGANANTAHTAYGIKSSVSNTNATSGTNIAGYFSASGATTANYGLLVAAGNVGIGDTTPVAPLTVGASDAFQVDASGNISSTGTTGVTLSGNAAGLAFTGAAANTNTITTANSNMLDINANGAHIYVGGSAGGTSQAGTIGFANRIQVGTGTTSQTGISFNGDANAGFNHPAADTITTLTNGLERFRVDSSGNVGVGSTSLTSLFNVGATNQFQVDSSGAIAAATGITSSGAITFSGLSTAGIVHNSAAGLLSTGLVNLTSEVTGTLPIANGGTNGTATPSIGQVAYGTGTAYAFTSGGSAGNCLTYNSGSAPTWGSCAAGSVGGTGTTNRLAKFTASSTIGDSSIADLGSTTAVNIDASGNVSLVANKNLGLTSGTGVFSQGYTNTVTGSADTKTITNSNASVTAANVKGIDFSLVGGTNANTNANTITGINFGNVTPVANNAFNGITFGTGFDNFLTSGTINISAGGAITGGTGITSSGTITFSGFNSNGGPLYTNGSGVLAQTTAGTSTQVLHGGTAPSFSAVSLTADVSGLLPTANGGLGANVTAAGGGELLYSTSTTAYGHLAAGTSGYFLTSGGTGAPSWTATVPATSVPFSGITSGTNTTAAMVVGAGASLNYTSTGTINASSLIGGTWAIPGTIGSTTPNTGAFTTLTASTSISSPLLTTASGDLSIDPTGDTVIKGSTAVTGTAALNVTNSTPTSLLYVRNDGNVGIANATPGYKLDVAGDLNASTGSVYRINGTSVLSNNTLGTGVLTSSLTTVAALNAGSITSGFGAIDTGADNITTTGTIGTASTTAFTGATAALSGQLTSTLATGTAPFVIASTTKVTNLNADLLDGIDSTGFCQTGGSGCPAPVSSLAFSAITSGTNTTAAMVVGAGASLNYTSTGTINASSLIGGTWVAPGAIGTTTPAAGNFTTIGATTAGTGAFTTLTASTSVSTPLLTTASGDLALDPTGNVVVKGSTAVTGTAALNVTNSTPTSLLYVRNDGNIGIANTTPGYKLDVAGDFNTTGAIRLSGGAGTATQLLHGGTTPSWAAVSLTADVSGTLPIANGGTNGTTTPSNGQVAYGTGTAYAFTSGGSTGNCLTYNSGSAPTWSACSTGSVTSVTNADGTLTISPTTGAVVASLNLGNANTWTALQTYNSGVTIGNNSNLTISSGTGTISQTFVNNAASSADSRSITNNYASTSPTTINGQKFTLTNGTNANNTNTVNGIDFPAATNTNTNTINGINFESATGFTNFLNTPTLDITSAGAITSAASFNGLVITANTGVITTGTWNGSLIPLAYGGTNKNMTAANGQVAYSDTDSLELTTGGSTGNCLTYNSGSAPTWGSCAAGSVSGTGSTNRLAKFTASSTIGDSSINDLNTGVAMTIDASGQVGIGTTVPGSRLDVKAAGTTTKALMVKGNSSNDANIAEFQNNAGTALLTIDQSGNLSTSGTTGATFTGTGSSILFATGTGTHSISASAGTLQLGAVTLNGTITGANQNYTGTGNISATSGSNTITGYGTIGTAATTAFTGTTGTFGTSVTTPIVDNGGTLSLGVSNSTSTSLGKTGTTLTINPTSWTATPTVSGLITATSGLTSNGTLTVSGGNNLVMSSGVGTFTQTYTPAGTTTTATGATFIPTFGVNAAVQTLTGILVNPNTNSNTDAADFLYGINIDNITGTAATETALRIGSGYDNLAELEGATNDGIETYLRVTDPTTTDKTITFPNATGTVAVSASGVISLDALGNITCPTCGTGGGSVTSITAGTGLAATPSNPITTTGTLTIDQSFSPTWTGAHIFTPSTTNDVTFNLDSDSTFARVFTSGTTNTVGSTYSITNSASSGTVAVRGEDISLVGTANAAGANTITGINFPNVTAQTNNTFNGITFGTGFTNYLTSGTLNISAAGAITGATGFNGLVVTANTGVITSGTWNGSTIPIAYGGTNGTSTPSNGQVAYGTGTAYAFTSGGSTGNCLSYNSGSAPTWIACGAGTVTGSGSTNRLAKFTGASVIGDSSINDLNTGVAMTIDASGQIGIGTTTPSGRFHSQESGAKTAANYAGYFENASTNSTTDGINKYGAYITSTGSFVGTGTTTPPTNNYGLYIDTVSGADNNYGAYIVGNVAAGIFQDASDSTKGLDPAGTSFGGYGQVLSAGALLAQSSGNVGVGLTAANYKLDVGETASARGLNVSNTYGTGTAYAGYFSKTGAATTNIGLYSTATGATNNYAGIFEAGNVGIGDTAPAVQLSVLKSSFTSPQVVLNDGAVAAGSYPGGINPQLVVRSPNGSTGSRPLLFGYDDTSTGWAGFLTAGACGSFDWMCFYLGTGNNKYLALQNKSTTLNIGGGDDTAFTNIDFKNSGNVSFDTNTLYVDATNNRIGIGLTNPASTLGVSGNASIGSTYATTAAPTNGLLVEGEVGIGATSASGKLTVNGTGETYGLYVTSGASAYAIRGDGSTGTGGGYFSDNNASGFSLHTLQSNGSGYSIYAEGGQNYFQGNVGIGDTVPSTPLDVVGIGTFEGNSIGTTSTDGVVLSNATAATAGVQIQYSPRLHLKGAGWSSTFSTSMSTDWIQEVVPIPGVSATSHLDFASSINGSAYSQRLSLLSSGNVGVGITNPGFNLEVNGTARINGNFTIGDASTDTVTVNSAAWTFANNTTIALPSSVNALNIDSNTFTVDTANNRIGIGITNPDSDLQIAGSAVFHVGATASSGLYYNSGSDTLTLGNDNGQNGHIILKQNGGTTTSALNSDATSYFNGGSLAIGSTSAADKLDITGGGIKFNTTASTVDFASTTANNTFIWKIPQKATSSGCATATAEGVIIRNTGGTQVGHMCITGPTNASANKLIYFAQTFTATSTDIAENYSDKDNSLQPGDVVTIDDTTFKGVKKSTTSYDNRTLGIISTEPGIALSGISEDGKTDLVNPKPVALSGRIPTKVSTINGSIKKGDPLTTSSIPGVAMKATEAGQIIGKALEDFNGSTGVIEVFANLTYADPSAVLTSTGDLNVTSSKEVVYHGNVTQDTNELNSISFSLTDSAGNLVTKIGAFSEIATGKIKGGLATFGHVIINGTLIAKNATVETLAAANATIDNLTSNIITANTKIISPVVQTDNLVANNVHTQELTVEQKAQINEVDANTIKPQNNNLTVDLSAGQNGEQMKELIIKGLNNQKVAGIDSAGNATFSGTLAAKDASISGQLASSSLQTNEATISGTLSAKEIKADNIDALSNKTNELSTQNSALSSNVNDIQKLLNDIQNQPLPNPQYYQTLNPNTDYGISTQAANMTGTFSNLTGSEITVTDKATLYNVFVGGNLTAGLVTIQDNEILALSSELRLSALSSINFLDGAVIVDRSGKITSRGAIVAQGGIETNNIKGIDGKGDINVKLDSSSNSNGDIQNSKFEIRNSADHVVAAVDASGSAQFKDLALDSYSATPSAVIAEAQNFAENGIYAPALKTNSAATGTGILPAHKQEIIMYNNKVTNKSLIYVTATSATQNKSLFVAEKVAGQYFKIALDSSLNTDVTFNWWIVN